MQSNDTTKPVGFPLFNKAGELVGITLIDKEDLPLVEDHTWRLSTAGYAYYSESSQTGRAVVFMHQIILGIPSGAGMGIQGDHIDRNRLNNVRSNLRVVTLEGNRQNRPVNANGTSKYRGVSWNKECNKWRAYANVDKKRYYIGMYTSEDEAGKAASEFRREHMAYAVD